MLKILERCCEVKEEFNIYCYRKWIKFRVPRVTWLGCWLFPSNSMTQHWDNANKLQLVFHGIYFYIIYTQKKNCFSVITLCNVIFISWHHHHHPPPPPVTAETFFADSYCRLTPWWTEAAVWQKVIIHGWQRSAWSLNRRCKSNLISLFHKAFTSLSGTGKTQPHGKYSSLALF